MDTRELIQKVQVMRELAGTSFSRGLTKAEKDMLKRVAAEIATGAPSVLDTIPMDMKAPNGLRIIGIEATVRVDSWIRGGRRDENGKLVIEFDDDYETLEGTEAALYDENGERVFIDEEMNRWSEKDIRLDGEDEIQAAEKKGE